MTRNIASTLAFTGIAAAAVAAAALVSGTSYADDITVDNTPFVSSRSRADVQAELLGQADALRSAASEWAMQSNQPPQLKSTYTREQARNEYKAARQEVNALNAEDSGSSYFSGIPLRRSPSATMGAPAAR